MNVPFTLKTDTLDSAFIKEADAKGLLNLKGHRGVGSMRASIYNAVTEQAVDALIHFMRGFVVRNSQIHNCVQMLNHRS
jgi:phosphoserine aminotransferase